MSTKKKLLEAAAGNAGEAVYVDDVFSTYLYEGNGTSDSSTNQIQNGLDLSGEGGLVWVKKRSGGTTGKSHSLWDTERGVYSRLKTDDNIAENVGTDPASIQFNSDGFTLQKDSELFNYNGRPYVSWSFRKQPGFFDVVTYTGTGSAKTVSHNLGSVPGMIIVKRLDSTGGWRVYHRGVDATAPEDYYLVLHNTDGRSNDNTIWNDTAPTSTEFTIGTATSVNDSGGSYIAYLFAHDAQDFGADSDESIIKCGSFTTDGSGFSTSDIDLGFEPQWLMIKRSEGGISDWLIYDVMRGMTSDYESTQKISANTDAFETGSGQVALKSNGFGYIGSTNSTYIYVAIRRPHKPASKFAATDLFAIDTRNSTGDGQEPGFRSGFPVDMNIFRTNITQSNAARVSSRLTGTKYLESSSDNSELTGSTTLFDYMNGWLASGGTSADAYSWMFRRAPGFFDVVTYTGTGTAGLSINHNLGVTPEMMIVKRRNASQGWAVYHHDANASPATGACQLESNIAFFVSSVYWNDTAPTDTVFTLGSSNITNNNNDTYIAYLFATVPGISKVGGYTGTASDIDVDCGFTSGARFVLIKRANAAEDWYLWDSERGIVAGNDPYIILNSGAAQLEIYDRIDPLSSGFTVTSSAGLSINKASDSYIFLAIA